MTTKVTNIYNLKLTPSQFGQSSLVVNCSQYDSLYRVIQFNLFNGNAVYSIPEGSVVTIRGTKKDMTGFEYECDYSNNVVTFPIRDQITIYPGKVPAELRIVNEGEIIGSWNFLFLVEESPLTNDTIISETQLPLLESALQASAEAENYKNLAQASADNASESEQNASESEANALTYSQNAQTSANSASQSEANALTYSQNASASATEAQGYAQDAEDSATQSADSATQASQSAATAQQIADNIADLVDEAQGYASQSSQSASQAQGYATQASQSATNASQSASNAQTYANNANQSAQNASSSATSAQTYAGNASTSATQSASSATQSAQSATNAQTYANNASASATQAQGYATNASDSATASADSATESQGYAQNASDSASEAQELVDTVEERIANKADIDGVYPKLVAGDLVESETRDDVFTYQVTDHTGKANINSIKGNTIVWNQLIQNGNFADATGWSLSDSVSLSVANNVLTATIGSTHHSSIRLMNTLIMQKGRKYLFVCDIKPTKNINVRLQYDGVATGITVQTMTANVWGRYLSFATMTADNSFVLYYNVNNVLTDDDTVEFRNCVLFDLSLMGLDVTASEFASLFPLPYYQYEQHKLLSFNGTGIKTVGFNQWDEVWERGYYDANGTKQPSSNNICCSNPIHVLPNTTYYTSYDYSGGMRIYCLDANGNVISDLGYKRKNTFVTPSDCAYIVWYSNSAVIMSEYNNDICINISSSRNGEYEPYKESSLSLPIAQYFPNGMKSAGSVYDELTPSKAITRVGTRAYQSGDESDSTLTTDGTNTNYPLTTPTEVDVDLDLSYSTYEGGTEQLLPANTDVPVTSPISMNVEFDFGENLNARLNKMLSCLAQVETSPSTHNYSVGSYLMYEYQLYKVTSAITTGQSLTVGTNIVATTVMSELLSLTA